RCGSAGLTPAENPSGFSPGSVNNPLFCLSLLLIIVFGGNQSLWYRWTGLPYLPTGSSMLLASAPAEGSLLALVGQGWDIRGSWLDTAIHLILPLLALSAAPITQWSRTVHESLTAALRHDTLRMAPGKGLLARTALYCRALCNACPLLLLEVHRTLPTLVSALLIVEITFNWQGMGQIYIRALGSSDYPVVIAFLLLSTEWLLMTALSKDILAFFLSRQNAVLLANR
ncbi:MAG: ABC transporter permease subunit, partial [Ardenticatenales bacterium]|nr:ABC transporter permease subunit [Ardenticatenales bacterium]